MVIGVLDSGLGGLDILARMIKRRLGRKYVYFADNGMCPYGNKSVEDLRFILKNRAELLLERGAEILVLACNTASVAGLKCLRAHFNIPIYGVRPAIAKAEGLGCSEILVLATRLTVDELWFRGDGYQESVNIMPLALTRLAGLVESDYPDCHEIEAYLKRELLPFVGVPVAVLGCTHYNLVTPCIARALPNTLLVDGNEDLVNLIDKTLPHRIEGSFASSVDFIFSGKNEEERYRDLLERLLKNA